METAYGGAACPLGGALTGGSRRSRGAQTHEHGWFLWKRGLVVSGSRPR